MKANIRDSVIPQLWRDASTWKFRYRHAGRARTLTLGAYPLLTPQAARRACPVAGALEAADRGTAVDVTQSISSVTVVQGRIPSPGSSRRPATNKLR
jgi:hypothetical protein